MRATRRGLSRAIVILQTASRFLSNIRRESVEASAVKVVGGVRSVRRSAPFRSGDAAVRTCVQADVVDLGGPRLGDVPTNVGADGHPYACARILDLLFATHRPVALGEWRVGMAARCSFAILVDPAPGGTFT
jgi:hypothetical protein